jgi:LuxR family transcriptional regulator, maltose regulon positive regulatory protein
MTTADGAARASPSTTRADEVARGWAALAQGEWQQARAGFEAAARLQDGPDAHEGLSWAAWWLEDVSACLDAREQAYRGYRAAGDERGAARMALWLGDDHVEFRGAHAVADGWFRRAATILDGLEPCPEHGWLAAFEAHRALDRGDLDDARALARRAQQLGRDHHEVALEMFALATDGVARVEQGEVEDGLGCLDEAAAAALSGEFEQLVPAAWVCCLVMSSCEQVHAHDRATQWCDQIEAFSRRLHTRFLSGVCRAHLGMLRAGEGRWSDAERELVAAVDELSANRPSWAAEAVVRLGQLRLQQGRHAEAQRLFDEVADHPLALLGMAVLRLDRDDPVAARQLLERLRRHTPPRSVTNVEALALLVRADLALGEHATAADRLAELRSAVVPTPWFRATVDRTAGRIAAATGEPERACVHLEDATQGFVRAGAPVEAAAVRVELAAVLLELGRPGEAEHVARAARQALAGTDATTVRRQADRLLDRLAGGASPSAVLTDRQVEVLHLVAEGCSDHEIADRLVLSPHTVHRHVANIYVRLGCSSRSAAVAEAARRGLLSP